MILYSNGCSYTWGGTLFPIVYQENNEYRTSSRLIDEQEEKIRLQTVYPHHLGKLLNADKVINDSMGCGSNARIVRTTLDYFNNLLLNDVDVTDHFVTIQWTELSRTEFCYPNDGYVGIMINGILYEGAPTNRDPMETMNLYYKEFDSDEKQLQTFLEQVYCLGNFFKLYKIPYLFFTHVSTIKNYFIWTKSNPKYPQEQFVKLLNQYIWFNDSAEESYLPMDVDRVKNGKHSHPSELGHKQWATKLYLYMIERRLI